MSGRKIIEGLQDAVSGNLSCVYINGETWVRQDPSSPEAMLATSRLKIAELTERIDVLEAELATLNAFIRAMTPPITEADIAAAAAEAIAIRPLIEAERAALKTEGRDG